VTILQYHPDIPKIQEAVHCFEEASGAKENRKIKSTSDRSMGYVSTNYGHSILQWSKYSRLPHSKVQDSANKSSSTTRARIRAQAQEAYCMIWVSTNGFNTYINTWRQRHGTSHKYAPKRWVRETDEYHELLVRLERRNISSTIVHPAKEERWRRMGPRAYSCQELCIMLKPSASARTRIRNTNCWMVTHMNQCIEGALETLVNVREKVAT